MPLGLRNYHRVNTSDTAEINARLFDEDDIPIPSDDVAIVRFTVQLPDSSQETKVGTVEEDGGGFLRWRDTEQLGEYLWIAQFTLSSGQVRSTRGSFEVIDPFNPPEPDAIEILSDSVWMRLEDCFDSEEGGPWLRDQTLAYFNKSKIPEFISDGLLDINLAPPDTAVGIGHFTTMVNGNPDPDLPVLTQATLLAVIRHLMRSYVEQPLPQGAQVVYEDRRDYLQRWQVIYQMELERFNRIVALWKRQFIGLGKSKVLVTAKAGRLLPAPLRTRNVGRGYY